MDFPGWHENRYGELVLRFEGHPFIDYYCEYTARMLYKVLQSPLKQKAYRIRRIITMIKSSGFADVVRKAILIGGDYTWQIAINDNINDLQRDFKKFDKDVKVTYKMFSDQ